MRKINFWLERIVLHEGPIFIAGLVVDRIIFHLFYKRYYKKAFGHYGENIGWGPHGWKRCIPRNIRLSEINKISLGNNCQIDAHVFLQAHPDGGGIQIGDNVRINSHVHIQAYSRIVLENHVLVAPYSHINSGNHGTSDLIQPIMHQKYRGAGPVVIKEGSWLGRNSHVLGGVALGKNSVVGAGAVVTKSFGDFSVIGGIPATLIRGVNDKKH